MPRVISPLDDDPEQDEAPASPYMSLPCHEGMQTVQSVLDALDPTGMLLDETRSLLDAPTSEERALVETSSGRRAAMAKMLSKVRKRAGGLPYVWPRECVHAAPRS